MGLGAFHRPFFFASSIFARPKSVISPCSSRLLASALFFSDHVLFSLRMEKYFRYVLLPRLCICPSIHPKQSASSRASPAFMVFGPPALPNKSQTPGLVRQFLESHFRNSSLLENSIVPLMSSPPYRAMDGANRFSSTNPASTATAELSTSQSTVPKWSCFILVRPSPP